MTNSTGTNAVAGVSDELFNRMIERVRSASINDRRYERPMNWDEADLLLTELQSLRSRLSCIEAGPGEVTDAMVERALNSWFGGDIPPAYVSDFHDDMRAALKAAALSPIGVEAEPVAWPQSAHPMVFMTAPDEGVLFDPQSKFHGWLMRRHPDGLWVSTLRLPAVDPEDNDLVRQLMGTALANQGGGK